MLRPTAATCYPYEQIGLSMKAAETTSAYLPSKPKGFSGFSDQITLPFSDLTSLLVSLNLFFFLSFFSFSFSFL